MIKYMPIIPLILLLITSLPAMTGEEILQRVDDNLTADSRIVTSAMVIHGRRSSRTVRSKSWTMGTEKAFSEYLSPPREAGTKMLKLGEELWIYSPSTDRTIQISGHMLRQPLMGSDLSYEDYMEDPVLSNIYTSEIEGEDIYNDRECYVIFLTAKSEDVSYQYRRLWVDKGRFLPLKEEWYGSGESLLKRIEVKEVREIGGRWYPTKAVFDDVLKDGDGTELIIEEIEFDVDIPEHIFSRAALRD